MTLKLWFVVPAPQWLVLRPNLRGPDSLDNRLGFYRAIVPRLEAPDACPRALIFDFNGTLSDDEPIMCEIFQEGLLRGRKRAIEVLRQAGGGEIERSSSDKLELGSGGTYIIATKIDRYRARVADGSSVPEHVREAVQVAAAAVPVAVVSGASRDEIEPVLSASGLATLASPPRHAEDD